MVRQIYIPDRGDVVWINFNSGMGREQKGKRPAVVISPKIYNRRSELAVVCPITSKKKGYPFEIPLDSEKMEGVILIDQIKTIDWKQRKIRFVFRIKPSLIREIQKKIMLLVS